MILGVAVINSREVSEQPAIPIRGTDLSEVILNSNEGRLTFLTNKDLSDLKLSDSEAFEYAETLKQHFSIKTLPEVLGIDLCKAGYSEDFADEAVMSFNTARDLYVLTNAANMFGAEVLMHSEVLRELHARIGDYYILPSSKHEVLAISKQFSPDIEDLKAMVQTINLTTVRPEDRLSDNVYSYDGKALTIAKADDKTIDNEVSKYQGRTMA